MTTVISSRRSTGFKDGRLDDSHGAIAALAAINTSFQASVYRLLFILRRSARQSTSPCLVAAGRC